MREDLDVVEAAIAEAAAAERIWWYFRAGTTTVLRGEPAGATGLGAIRTRTAVRPIAALAAEVGVAVVLPLFERIRRADFHNSAAVIDHGDLAGIDRGMAHPVARKLHLRLASPAPGFDEPAHFTAGDWLGVHSLRGYRSVCWLL